MTPNYQHRGIARAQAIALLVQARAEVYGDIWWYTCGFTKIRIGMETSHVYRKLPQVTGYVPPAVERGKTLLDHAIQYLAGASVMDEKVCCACKNPVTINHCTASQWAKAKPKCTPCARASNAKYRPKPSGYREHLVINPAASAAYREKGAVSR